MKRYSGVVLSFVISIADLAAAASLPSSPLAQKGDLRINVWGKEGDGLIDDLRVWSAEPNAT